MQSQFIACYILISPDGVVSHGASTTFPTLEKAQSCGEEDLPNLTAALAPATVILMIREIAA